MPRYTFAPFSLDPEARVLLRDREQIPITAKTLDMLIVLVQNRGRLVDKDELLSRVWPGTVVEEANLTQSIFTLRKILADSPKDPHYIATIPGRGYQFVAPVTELTRETLQTDGVVRDAPQEAASDFVIAGSLIQRHTRVAIALTAVAILAAGVLWFVPRRPTKAPAELVERRLTFNSSATEIASAAISPDGKYLAYSDPAGIHVRLLSTGEERLIPTPSEVPAGAFTYVDSWFPDGSELLAHSRAAGGHGSMWAVSIMGQSSRELRGDSMGWSVSPDGTRIAFSPLGIISNTREIWLMDSTVREIWVMDSHGGNPQRVLGLPSDESLWSVHWSPDGQRLAYIRTQQAGQSIETCDLRGANRTAVVVASGLGQRARSISWLSDRRIVYSKAETADVEANLWQIGVDTHTGTPTGKPKRITRWAGSDLQGLSASADGTRLVLQKVTDRRQVYIGELAAGAKPGRPPRPLTRNEADDWATAWTADSKAVLLKSNRGGISGIFKQGIDQDRAEPLVEGRDHANLPRLSPDGAWVLYSEASLTAAGQSRRYRLMRVPVTGGLPKLVYETTAALLDDYQCARPPASRCVIIETSLDKKRLTVTAFDPLRGKGELLRTIEKDKHVQHALSPDGSTIAIARVDEPEIHIRLFSLTGGSDREIVVKGWPNLGNIHWSPDGKGFYCGSVSSQMGTLLYVDLKGNAQVLWHSKEVGGGRFISGTPSPDGRYLALCGANRNTNVWMVEGF